MGSVRGVDKRHLSAGIFLRTFGCSPCVKDLRFVAGISVPARTKCCFLGCSPVLEVSNCVWGISVPVHAVLTVQFVGGVFPRGTSCAVLLH